MKSDYDRSVTLHCPTCGNSEMEVESLDANPVLVRCPSCGRSMTEEELINENGESIDVAVDELKEEIFNDIQKDFHDSLKRAFRGSKNIKIR